MRSVNRRVSLSTLDRKIRKGEVEVAREGRRVYLRMQRPESLGDEELLRRAITRAEELKQTVRELERKCSLRSAWPPSRCRAAGRQRSRVVVYAEVGACRVATVIRFVDQKIDTVALP